MNDDAAMKKGLVRIIKKMLIIMLWLAVWQVAAFCADNKILLVGPIDTFKSVVRLLMLADTYKSVLNTFLAVIGGGLGAVLLGIILARLASKSAAVREILSPFVSAVRSVPVVCFIVLILIMLGAGRAGLAVSGIVTFPLIYTSVLKGMETIDPGLIEMADIYGIKGMRRLKFLEIPAVRPYLSAGLLNAAGMAIRSAVAAEVIGQAKMTIGNGIYRSRIYLDTADLLAWTVIIVTLSYAMEKIIKRVLK